MFLPNEQSGRNYMYYVHQIRVHHVRLACAHTPPPLPSPAPSTRPQKGTVRVLLPGIITQNLEKVFKVWQEGWGWNAPRVRACVRVLCVPRLRLSRARLGTCEYESVWVCGQP